MQLFDGETSVYRGFGLVVTNRRVIYEAGELRTATIDCLGMCRYEIITKLWTLILGAVALLAGFVLIVNNNPGGFVPIAIGVALVIAYFVTKRSVLRIYAGQSFIEIEIKGHRAEELEEAINFMQRAHLEFLSQKTAEAPKLAA